MPYPPPNKKGPKPVVPPTGGKKQKPGYKKEPPGYTIQKKKK